MRLARGVAMRESTILRTAFLVGAVILARGSNEATAQETFAQGSRVVAVDHFGRVFHAVSSYRSDKQVGLFFWLWIGQPYARGIYDATKIMQMPDGVKLLYSFDHLQDSISPDRQAHFWGEPLWGYYNSDDEWVIRRQLQLLTVAGIDFIVFDATNYQTFENVYPKILKVVDEYIGRGWNPPKVVFYTHARSIKTTLKLYKELYAAGLYPRSWYRMKGKPLIIAYTNVDDDLREASQRRDSSYVPLPLPPEVLDFFYFKKPQWPFDPIYEDGFPWIEWTYPQPLHGDIMSVTVASHPNVPMSRSITQGVENWGRGWDPLSKTNVSDSVDKGTFFQLQWDHALKVNPALIFIGGWNEWIAIKQPWGGEYMLCDAASKEYSRDIEPMRGGYQDAFLVQMILNIRKYKGLSDSLPAGEFSTIDIAGDPGQWNAVKQVYQNIDTQMPGRTAYGAAKTVLYTQVPPRNPLQEIKVCHDEQNLYFYIRSREDITPDDGKGNWMNLFIGTGNPSLKGWEGYEYLVGKESTNGTRTVERLGKDFAKSRVGTAEYAIRRNILQMKLPRELLGLSPKQGGFYFKVADGIEHPNDIMDYYISGVSLPLGRFSYVYNIDHSAEQ